MYSSDRVGKSLRGTGRRPDCGPVPWFWEVDVQAMLWACSLVLGGGDLLGNGEVMI